MFVPVKKHDERRKLLPRHCINCARIFWARPDAVYKGREKFCSEKCSFESKMPYLGLLSGRRKGKMKKISDNVRANLLYYAKMAKSESTKKKMSEAQKGEKSKNWKGGITKERNILTNDPKYKNWRKAVYERDNYRCAFCGQNTSNLNAHHIIPFSEISLRHEIGNGITVCNECHWIIHNLQNHQMTFCPLPKGNAPFSSNGNENNIPKSGKAKSLRHANPEPSLNYEEGVETGRDASYMDEGTVQTTNIFNGDESRSGMSARMVYVGKI